MGLLLLVQATGHGTDTNGVSAVGAWLYFWSRVVYLPLYVFGVLVVRSFAFGGSLIGMGLIASQVL